MDDLHGAADPKAGRKPRPPEPTVQSGWKKAIGVGMTAIAAAATAALPRCACRTTEVQVTAAPGSEPRFDASASSRLPGGAPAAPAFVPGPGAGVRVDDVSLTFRGARTVTALERISLEIAPREVVALIGPNGCG